MGSRIPTRSAWNAPADGGSDWERIAMEWTVETLMAAVTATASRAARRFSMAGKREEERVGSPELRTSFPTEMVEMEEEGRKGRRLAETQEAEAEGEDARKGMSELRTPRRREMPVPERAEMMVGSASYRRILEKEVDWRRRAVSDGGGRLSASAP